MSIHFKETCYGFEYGAANVSRICSDKKKQWIVLGINTKKVSLQIYVTKTGKIRVNDGKNPQALLAPSTTATQRKICL